MNPKGAESLLYSKVKLGADASAAAGPKGRTAEGATDIVMDAEILSYSRNKGLFAGVSLEGSTLRSDGSANEKLYGKKLTAKEIIRQGRGGIPASASLRPTELQVAVNVRSQVAAIGRRSRPLVRCCDRCGEDPSPVSPLRMGVWRAVNSLSRREWRAGARRPHAF
jgi:hypothetical protein